MRILALCVCLCFGLLTESAATVGVVRSSTPLRAGPHGEPIVDVRVNGEGPFPFILDTGSTHSSISDRLARALGAPIVAKAPVASSLGEHIEPIVRLERLEVGGTGRSTILATEVGEDSLDDGGNSGVSGILGQDVLGERTYTLNFADRRVDWDTDVHGHSDRASTLTLRNARGRFLAELPQDQNRATLWLVPDTGAETLVLYQRPHVQLPPITRQPNLALLSTLRDHQMVQSVTVTKLRVGRTNLRDIPAVLIKRTDADPSFGDGLLPLAIFDRVTFDGPGRRLLVER